MHLFIYSSIHLFIYSFIHLFIYSFIHFLFMYVLMFFSFAYSLIHLFACFMHLLIYSFMFYLSIHSCWFIHSCFIHSFIHLSICLFIYLSIHLFIYSCIYFFIYVSMCIYIVFPFGPVSIIIRYTTITTRQQQLLLAIHNWFSQLSRPASRLSVASTTTFAAVEALRIADGPPDLAGCQPPRTRGYPTWKLGPPIHFSPIFSRENDEKPKHWVVFDEPSKGSPSAAQPGHRFPRFQGVADGTWWNRHFGDMFSTKNLLKTVENTPCNDRYSHGKRQNWRSWEKSERNTPRAVTTRDPPFWHPPLSSLGLPFQHPLKPRTRTLLWNGVEGSFGGLHTWGYPQSSSILIGFSLINHPFWGTHFWKPSFFQFPSD